VAAFSLEPGISGNHSGDDEVVTGYPGGRRLSMR